MTDRSMHARTRRGLLLGALAFAAARSGAEAPREIGWEQLVIRLAPEENPFAMLAPDQLEALADVAALRDRRARGATLTDKDNESERAAMVRLKQAKVDVDGLLARREEVAARLRSVATAVNPELDGKLVRMPGYLLPLEYAGRAVTEFLLVPWVGACVHTPPPPPNQIVHVRPDKPVEVRGAFDAVWVVGRMATRTARKEVHIVDGSSEVEVGYAMQASLVQPYR
jgi:hypothetical protein